MDSPLAGERYIYTHPPTSLYQPCKGCEREEPRGRIYSYTNHTFSCSFLRSRNRKIATMSRFGGAPLLPVHHEDEDEELFEKSSSISGDSDDEAQFSDSEDAETQEQQFAQQAASPSLQPVRRLNSDSLYDLSSMMAQLPVKKGLSKYYDGKSQSFARMSEVRCLEDLRKRERAPTRRSNHARAM